MFGCDVFMYDPTPESFSFMNKFKGVKSFKFKLVGIWTKDEEVKFFIPKNKGSATMMTKVNSKLNFFKAQCYKMESILNQNQHKLISIFKADIEGTALPVLQKMVESKIYHIKLS